jgi:hypothetical protein
MDVGKRKMHNTNFAVEIGVWKEFRKRCIDLGISTAEYMRNLIKKEVEKHGKSLQTDCKDEGCGAKSA